MKLSSSPLIVYSLIYSISLALSIIFNFLLSSVVSSPLLRVYIIDFHITCILYVIGNFVFHSNNIYDLHWPLVPLLCSIYFPFTSNSSEFLSLKCLPLMLVISLWSCHLIRQTISSSDNIKHEDWRYQMMRKQYENNFLVFSFFALHLLPMFEVLIGSSAIYYICTNTQRYEHMTIGNSLLLLIILVGVVLESIADKQLADFRRHRPKSREHRFAVISSGLWKYSRHPNYLGELIFWWGLFFLGYVSDAPLWCALAPFLITIMMIFESIPMSEERLYRRYPEYKFVQRRISILIPTFDLLG